MRDEAVWRRAQQLVKADLLAVNQHVEKSVQLEESRLELEKAIPASALHSAPPVASVRVSASQPIAQGSLKQPQAPPRRKPVAVRLPRVATIPPIRSTRLKAPAATVVDRTTQQERRDELMLKQVQAADDKLKLHADKLLSSKLQAYVSSVGQAKRPALAKRRVSAPARNVSAPARDLQLKFDARSRIESLLRQKHMLKQPPVSAVPRLNDEDALLWQDVLEQLVSITTENGQIKQRVTQLHDVGKLSVKPIPSAKQARPVAKKSDVTFQQQNTQPVVAEVRPKTAKLQTAVPVVATKWRQLILPLPIVKSAITGRQQRQEAQKSQNEQLTAWHGMDALAAELMDEMLDRLVGECFDVVDDAVQHLIVREFKL